MPYIGNRSQQILNRVCSYLCEYATMEKLKANLRNMSESHVVIYKVWVSE